MGRQLDFLLGRGGGSSGRRFVRPRSFGSRAPFRAPRPSDAPPTLTAPERWDINEGFNSLSDTSVGIFGVAGQIPSRVMENPVSIADTATRLATGGRIKAGSITGGFSPVEAIGSTPAGGVFGALGEATKRAGNFVPSLINSSDAALWRLVSDLPDDTEITDDLVGQRGGLLASGTGLMGKRTGDIPILGSIPILNAIPFIGGRNMTVGEFRAELAQRGFFYDESTGQPTDPAELAQRLRSGKSIFDFGYAATNENSLVDLVTRMTTDPTNALFFVPGANLAKLGQTAARLLPASRLIRAGAMAERAPRAIVGAEAILRGDRTQATLGGLARALRAYRTGAIATTALTYGVNAGANAINNLAGDDLPFVSEIRDFTQAVQNNQPMSGNPAFMLLSAATFPYGQYARNTAKGVRAARTRVFGVGDTAPFIREYGGKAKLQEEFGGPDGVRELMDFLDVQIVRDLGKITPAEQATLANIGSMSLRRRFEQQALWRVVERARKAGEITGDMRLEKWKQFHAEQGGFKEHGLANPWDPSRAARRWRAWKPVRERIQPVLDETGEVIWGLRDDVVFIEQIEAVRGNLKDAIYRDENGVKRVRREDILDALEDNPNLNSLDKQGKWARWGNDAVDPTWDAVSRKLAHQKRDAVKIDDYTAELTQWERKAPPDIDPDLRTREQRIDDLRSELAATYDETGAILPDRVAESQRLQRMLEDELAQLNDIHWARTEKADRKTGGDPAVGRSLNETIESDDTLAPPRLSPGLSRLDDATVQRVAALEAEVVKINPSYRVKRAPEKDILALVPPDSAIGVAIRHRRAVREWLFEAGPFSTLSNFWHTITRPVARDELARGAKQALMNELVPLGVEPKMVEHILSTLDSRVKESVLVTGPGGFKVRWFRDVGSIPPGMVSRIVEDVLNGNRKTGEHKALAAIRDRGGFYRILAKASSRYGRSLAEKAGKGDKGAKVLRTVYDIWNDAPLLSKAATTQRVVAKFVYPLFRFALDPRWLALNMTEANALSLSKYGYLRTYKNMDEASAAARHFARGDDVIAQGSLAPDSGWSLGRELELFAAKSFDAESINSVGKVLDDMGENSPALVEIRRNMRIEAELMRQRAKKQLDDGQISQRQYDADIRRAERLEDGGTRSMAEHLNETLYSYETIGVDATVTEVARSVLSADELATLRDTGLLDRVVDVNRKTWDDIQQLYHGNPKRSTLERVMNSYWLFWPISYQIKATKWLTDIMLNGSFGQHNNALLAGKYALFQQEHQERMKNNPAYAAMYASHPSLWFVAQMLLPMSPEDIGVSMSRATRLAGTSAQGFLNGWLGTEIGAFTAEKQAEDPAAAIGWLTNMGPTYTVELAQRLFTEADDVKAVPPTFQQSTPTPSTGLPSLPVR